MSVDRFGPFQAVRKRYLVGRGNLGVSSLARYFEVVDLIQFEPKYDIR